MIALAAVVGVILLNAGAFGAPPLAIAGAVFFAPAMVRAFGSLAD